MRYADQNKHANRGLLRSLSLTAFHIDWKDTQINAFLNSPGALAQVVADNTAGAIRPWPLGIVIAPGHRFQGWASQLRVDVNHRDDMYERPVKGLVIGGRTLFDLGLTLSRDAWRDTMFDLVACDDHFCTAARDHEASGPPELWFGSHLQFSG